MVRAVQPGCGHQAGQRVQFLAVGVPPRRAVHDGQVQSGGNSEQVLPVALDIDEIRVEPGDPRIGGLQVSCSVAERHFRGGSVQGADDVRQIA